MRRARARRSGSTRSTSCDRSRASPTWQNASRLRRYTLASWEGTLGAAWLPSRKVRTWLPSTSGLRFHTMTTGTSWIGRSQRAWAARSASSASVPLAAPAR